MTGHSPASTLLPDVLAEILKAWITVDAKYWPQLQTPYRAAGVCSHWRAVAISTASIWTNLRIDFEHLQSITQHVEIVLSRCRHAPIVLELLHAPTTSRTTFLQDDFILELLVRSRNIRIEFTAQRFHPDTSLLPLFQGDMPHLQQISFFVGTAEHLNDLRAGTRLLIRCPNLEVLDLGHIFPSYVDPQTMPLLRSFTALRPLIQSFLLSLCGSCPRLATLDVSVGSSIPDGTVAFPQLTHLSGDNLLKLLTPARVPRLRSLQITRRSINVFTSFIGSSPWIALEQLSLSHLADGDGVRLVSAFEYLPNLVSLTMLSFFASDIDILFTAWKDERFVLLPGRLQQLHLLHGLFTEETARGIIDFLRLRRASCQATGRPMIKRVRIYQSTMNMGDVLPESLIGPVRQLVETAEIDVAEMDHML